MNRTVLLIEDNEQNCYLATFLLQAHGFQVVEAHDGPEGISLAASVAPTVILLDIELPTLTGYEVARALRQIESLSHVPIIAVTSYAMPGDRDKAIAAGCTGYIEKPIDPDSFVAEIAQYLPASP